MRLPALNICRLLAQLARDERGGEVLEWAMVVGLLIAAAIATVSAFGTKVLAKWTSVDSSIN